MKQIKQFRVTSLADLEMVSDWLSVRLKQGDCLGLAGPLGAGKTTLTQSLAARLGIREAVDSPTFTLRQSYPATHLTIKQLVHYDFYRLLSTAALAELGLADDWAQPQSLLVIEWVDKFPELLDQLSYLVTITLNKTFGNFPSLQECPSHSSGSSLLECSQFAKVLLDSKNDERIITIQTGKDQ
ncbi:MAG: tRNA (adenosine(37)-N6)-threonylcarbamoyltransferase complex ATPase subunit type 1 TsaE [Patescibacteria group bacterium]